MCDEVFFVCWDGEGGLLVGKMILCGNRADVDEWVGGAGVSLSLKRTLDGRRREHGGFIFKPHNNK